MKTFSKIVVACAVLSLSNLAFGQYSEEYAENDVEEVATPAPRVQSSVRKAKRHQEEIKAGARLGFTDVDVLGSALTLGGFGEYSMSPNLSLRGGLDYWSKEIENTQITISDMIFSGVAKYSFSLSESTVKPYLIGGLAMHRVTLEVKDNDSTAAASLTNSDTSLDLGGGFSYAIDRDLEFSGELLLRSYESVDMMSFSAGLSHKL